MTSREREIPFHRRACAVKIVEDLLPVAAVAAVASPCAKSKRGVVLFRENGTLIARGHNAQPEPFVCDGSETCRAHCAKICEHAEAAALRKAGAFAHDAHLLHVKVVRGVAVPSGPPSCWQCSRAILAAGILSVWLLHEDGVRGYSAEEFHDLTWRHVRPDVPLARR